MASIGRHVAGAVNVGVVLLALGCGGEKEKPSEPPTNPVPVLLGVTPSDLGAGTGATTIELSGSGFVQGSRARWNGADRVTRYQSAAALSVDLLAADVASLGTGKVSVLNGAPGGGVSSEVTVTIGIPVPTLTSITPNAFSVMPTEEDSLIRVFLVGRNFHTDAWVEIDGDIDFATYISPTRIDLFLRQGRFTRSGTRQLVVLNGPIAGSGKRSNAVPYTITYARPAIGMVSPDSVYTGGPATLSVFGNFFTDSSVVRWNGADRPTTRIDGRQLSVDLSASDLATAGSQSLTVFNPTPGGGVSAPASVRVREPGPLIAALVPATITVGSAPVTVAVNGSNFKPGASVQWNGAPRTSTFVSATSLSVTLTAADVGTPRSGQVTVTNPGANTSNAMIAVVRPAVTTLDITRTIAQQHEDLVWDATRGVFYASVPIGAVQNANSVVRIDPNTGAITGSVALSNSPGQLAITEGGEYLYAALGTMPRIVRIALATFTRDLEFTLSHPARTVAVTGTEDLLPIPGQPRSVAVTFLPAHAGTVLYDDSTRRSYTLSTLQRATRLAPGPNVGRLVGYDSETGTLRIIRVGSDGLYTEAVQAGAFTTGSKVDIETSQGYAFSTLGDVVDLGTRQRIGRINVTGAVSPDVPNGRVHTLANQTLRSWHYTSLVELDALTHPSLAGHTRLIRWGPDGLAAGGGDTIVLLRGSRVAP